MEVKRPFSAVIYVVGAIILFLVGNYVGRGKIVPPTPNSDTTIVINNYYDTTIHVVETKTIYQTKSVYYKEYDTSIVVTEGMCDSVRSYEVESGNDSIELTAQVDVLGALLHHKLSYKWLLPYKTEITKTIYAWKSGPVIGLDLLVKPSPQLGIHGGWRTKQGTEYSVGYLTDKSILFSVEKGFNFGVKNRAKNNTAANNDL